jgi:Mg2+/Co2+ transporter CorB
VAARDGAARGREALGALAGRERLAAYPFYPAAMGELELRRGEAARAREHFRAALAVARNAAVVVATALAEFLISRETGHSWPVLIAIAAGSVLVLVLLDALPRLVVARSPEAWGLRLVPLIGAVRAIFGPLSWAIDHSLGSVVGHNGESAAEDEAETILRLVEDE